MTPTRGASHRRCTSEEVDAEDILVVLELNEGDQARTAQMLDIGTATRYRKLEEDGSLRGRDVVDATPPGTARASLDRLCSRSRTTPRESATGEPDVGE